MPICEFYDNNWWNEIINAIANHPRAVYCCRCKAWCFETQAEGDNVAGYAAYLKIFNELNNRVLDINWIKKDVFSKDDVVDVPCVLGACYAATKEYWSYLKGYNGLKLYSCEEAYISIKAWMEGGGCRLLKNVEIGHLFRKKFPYKVISKEYTYNKLLIAETLLPEEIKNRVIKTLKVDDYTDYYRSKKLLDENKSEVESLKQYYSSYFQADFSRFAEINDRMRNLLNEN